MTSSLAYSNSSHSSTVQALCRDVLNAGINLNISLADEMLLFFHWSQGHSLDEAVGIYFESGRRIWKTLRQILVWKFGSLSSAGQILDFASGFGRVTRHIAAEISPESIWISDIDADGVAFQQREFGAHGIVSTADPDQFPCDRTFNCILVSSLFTHLPEPSFMGWLRRLGSLVKPGGILLFSVHDASLRIPDTMPDSGFLFEELSESSSLDTSGYGSSWVTEELVRSAVRQAIGPGPVLRIPRGLVSFQDLYVVLVGEEPDAPDAFSGLKIAREPDGFLEHCSWAGRRTLRLSGWVGDRVTRKPPREVLIRIDGVLVASCRDLTPLPPLVGHGFHVDPMDVFGWQARLELPQEGPAELACLSVSVVSSEGEEMSLYSDAVLWACLRSAQLDAAMLQRQLAQKEAERTELARQQDLHESRAAEQAAELVRQRDLYEFRVEQLASRVHAMESSRFWKARNLWFRFKRAVGLTTEL